MHRISLAALSLATLVAVATCLVACTARHSENPTVTAEKEHWGAEGWEFVAVVGEEPHGTFEEREVRTSDSSGDGELMVYASSSGIDGHGVRSNDVQKLFKETGYKFLEVKIMTSPADGYSIVFRKKACPSSSNPLIGHWTLIKIPTRPLDPNLFRIEWEFTPDEIIVRDRKNQEEVSRNRYTVDLTKSPAWITVTVVGPSTTETRLGVFRFTGDELDMKQRIGQGERPKDLGDDFKVLRRVVAAQHPKRG